MEKDESNFFDKFKNWFEEFAKTNKPKEDKSTPPVLPDYSQLQHNAKAIQDLKDSFEKQLTAKDETIKELNSKFEAFMQESLKDKEERAAREKAYQEDQEKTKAETLAKERQAVIDLAIKENRIAPKDEEFLNTLKDKSIEDIKVIVSKLPAQNEEPRSNNNSFQQGQKSTPSTNLGRGATVDEYLSDLTINN